MRRKLLDLWGAIVSVVLGVSVVVSTLVIPVLFFFMLYYLYYFDFLRICAFAISLVVSTAYSLVVSYSLSQ